MRSRLIVALIFIPLLIYILLKGDMLLLLFTNIVIVITSYSIHYTKLYDFMSFIR